ncbi:MAG: hypothetical protein A2091_02400 [Desulfuromonadales bacterium GWD2_61_12]|nr:MAG: hypothetical protein A2005_04065 [Desulfuromonadales bacterium GWC2_61_20]OGR34154.1 MAG: hypothetical protein A2091_02400 [Desulfuromonadales bacterium GWD2_61_12]HAD03448.1 hypothetical protein [Desulfuromonas sp.]HBT83461.1 hypothetical protein [Desulfuromonas sp.]
MLDLIRKKKKSVIIKIVFWSIIATFVGTIFLVWGKGDDAGQPTAAFAVEVNGDSIALEDYQSAYANIYRLYQNVYRDQLTPALEKQLNLRQQALDALIEQELLLQQADRLQLRVGKQELVDAIAKIPAFQKDGLFNKETYIQVLRGQRLTPESFESLQERDLLIEKVRNHIRQNITVDESEIQQEYRDRNEKVDLLLVRVDPAAFESRVRIEPAPLQSYFAANVEKFRLPQMASLRYITFDPARYRGEVVLAEDEIKRYYDRNLDRFEIPEQVKAAHILIRTPQGADAKLKEQKRAEAAKILAAIKAGKDFAAAARSLSEDPGSAGTGGDLGSFTRGTMVGPFEEAAFALKVGEVSDIVETTFGFHIIKVSEHTTPRIKAQSEVLAEIKDGLQSEKSAQLALEKALDAFNINRKGGSLEAAAKAAGIEISSTGTFARDTPIGPFGVNAEINNSAFALTSVGELGRPVRTAQGVVLFALEQKLESRVPELKEVRVAVEQAYRQEEGKKLASNQADALLALIRKGGDLSSTAVGAGLSKSRTGLFARARNNFVPQAGVSEGLMTAAFTLTPAAPAAPEVYEIEGSYLIALLAGRQSAEATGMDPAKLGELRTAVLSRKQDEALDKELEGLKAKAKIVYSDAFKALLEG